jgi:adenylate kinase
VGAGRANFWYNLSEMIISIIGPSGCGKGTQAKLLAEKLGVPAISGGEVLRREYEAGTPEGVAAEKYWGEGKWPPADLIMKILKKRLDQPDCQNGFILDGAPREIDQIPLLEDYFATKNQKFDLVLHLDTSDESCLSRLTQRIFAAREKGEQVRADEDPEEIKERLRQYHQTIEPVLKYFAEKGILRRINNEQPIKDVFEEVSAAVEELS